MLNGDITKIFSTTALCRQRISKSKRVKLYKSETKFQINQNKVIIMKLSNLDLKIEKA